MSNKNNYDCTAAGRQKTSRNRRARSYIIVKAIAQRLGYMENPLDMLGLDKFLNKFSISGHEMDWFEAIDDI